MGTTRNAEIVLVEPASKRPYRFKQERRAVVEATLRPWASMAVIARRDGVNANQVFHWRKLYREGRLDVEPPAAHLVPVRMAEVVSEERLPTKTRGGVIVLEIEPRAHPHRGIGGCAGSSSRSGAREPMIALPAGTNIWIAAGITDLRRGFTELSAIARSHAGVAGRPAQMLRAVE